MKVLILYDEEDILGGFDPYSASKAAVEIAVKAGEIAFVVKENIKINLLSLLQGLEMY